MKASVQEKNKTVFILDDDVSIIEALTAGIQMTSDYSIVSATSFLEYTRKSEPLPDVILLDVRLGNKDGKEVAKILKSTQSTKDIPLIMMSGMQGEEEKCRSAGADDYLEKPFTLSELLSTFSKHLG